MATKVRLRSVRLSGLTVLTRRHPDLIDEVVEVLCADHLGEVLAALRTLGQGSAATVFEDYGACARRPRKLPAQCSRCEVKR